tara:strand:- start:342 stop:515 length:174 start_codon:yes stop_codon:yes gene_type:complete
MSAGISSGHSENPSSLASGPEQKESINMDKQAIEKPTMDRILRRPGKKIRVFGLVME